RRRQEYEGARPNVDPAGRSVIVVDDGVATGMTMQVALRAARCARPIRLVAATPVATREAVAMLRRETDDIVCLSAPRRFLSVGSLYRDSSQVTDEAVVRLLREARGDPCPAPPLVLPSHRPRPLHLDVARLRLLGGPRRLGQRDRQHPILE